MSAVVVAVILDVAVVVDDAVCVSSGIVGVAVVCVDGVVVVCVWCGYCCCG